MIRISMAATLVIISIALASAQETKKATQELKKSDPDSKKTDPADDAFRQFKEPQLAKELSVRFQSDQAARNELVEFQAKYKLFGKQELNKVDRQVAAHYKALVEKVQNEDKKNLLWLKEVIAKHGWPGKTLVGPTSSQSAWLLAQHADTDRKFQRTCLAKMEAMPKGEVEPANIAYLTDRILVGAGKKQKYGT